jgi:hydrogenase/urease accessory protein HupE
MNAISKVGAWIALLVCIACMFAARADAHEIRPAYLEITETAANQYAVIWHTPLLSGMRLPIAVALPDGTRNLSLPVVIERSDSLIERRNVEIEGGLNGKRIGIVGLEATITDVLVRLSFLDGSQVTSSVRPSQPYLDVATSRGWLDIAQVYLVEGIQHILQGVDHLLFVLGLMLLVRSRLMLLKTITAFTVAHSITLAASTLGYINVPAGPLNAAIALSILFLGVEVVRASRGETSLAIRQPWAVAFAFGLLHGVGFASGLSMLGLPPGDIPAALLAFNVGVEIGQLLFVGVILALEFAFRRLEIRWPTAMARAPSYAVGILGAYWTIDRIMAMGATW